MNKFSFLLYISAMIVATPATAATIADRSSLNALLGNNQVLEDFEKFTNTIQLTYPSLDSNTDWSGQGRKNLVDGIVFSGFDGVGVVLNPDAYLGLSSRTLGGEEGNRFQFVFTQPVTAFGIDLKNYAGFRSQATISVYDRMGSLIHTGTGRGGGTAAESFFGFESAGGIGRVQISDAPGAYSVIDNISFGVAIATPVPEPVTWAMMLTGFAMIGGGARYRRRAARIALG